ncbi:hypothetical protein SUGI_0793650 [Cryptomeria japonica]|nr:hypothetical protein SUGI_0793650 [Cryptomeria japonica]
MIRARRFVLEMKGGVMIAMLFLVLAMAFTLTAANAIQNANTSSSPYDVFALHHPYTEGRLSVTKDRMLLHKVYDENKDVEALLSFRHGITADPMRSLFNWTSTNSENLCSWTGVWCTKHTNRVVAIILLHFGLKAEAFHINLANCSQLQWIRQSYNNLTGGIPVEFGGLGKSQHLRFPYNSLSGGIPNSLRNCTSLLDLSLSFNYLTGNCTSLLELNLGATFLTGTIPKPIGELKSLRYLFLEQSILTGPIPSELGDCTSLTFLDLRYNLLTGTIPKAITELNSLEILYLNSNILTGTIPLEIGKLKNLGELISLEILHVSHNRLSGKIPPSIGKCKHLTALVLSDNLLSGGIPATLTNCIALTRLKLSNNLFNGDLQIQFSSSIEVLSAHSNNFCGTLPTSLANCTQLKLLDFSRNRLVGELSSHALANCLQLRVVSLGSIDLKGDIPLWLRDLNRFQVLDLSNNKFGGRIPSILEDLEGFQNPRDSQLTGNTLYEDIPAINIKGYEFRLEYVLASNTILDLSHNNLRGEIPKNIGSLSQLRLLNLSGNQLEGMIPASLGQIEPLEQLDLSQNSLSGKLPVELSNLSKLSYWDVSFNHLCGPIPGGTQLMTFDERSYQGNPPCLCGYPFERCKQNKSPIVLSPSERVGKSVWSKVNEHVSVIGLGLGFEIGLGGTISLLVWWDRLVCYVRSPRIRGVWGYKCLKL